MKSLTYLLAVVLVVSFASCGKNSSAYKTLKVEQDSLLLVQEGLKNDVREFLAVIKHFDASVAKLQSAEADHIQQIRTKLSARENAIVNDNIARFNAFLQSNAEKSEQTQKQLNFSNAKRRELESKSRMLAEELERKTDEMQKISANKDANIAELKQKLVNLDANLDETKEEKRNQTVLIENHEKALYSAYYIAAPKSELKAKNILTTKALCKSFLFAEDFDRSLFTELDARKNEIIILPKSVSGKLLSAHPRDSYKLEKIDGQKQLEILDAEKFWSITKYLVIR